MILKKNTKNIKKKPVIVAVSGYFNPLHVGHIEMIQRAKKLGDKLVVIVNNDKQVALKGSVPFMPEKDRIMIISALRDVDKVFLSLKFSNKLAGFWAILSTNMFCPFSFSKFENGIDFFFLK